MKKLLLIMTVLMLSLMGCGNESNQEVRKFIQEAFKVRADAVFLYKDKSLLTGYYSPAVLEQSGEYLNWSPNGQWNNVKDLKYSITMRIDNLKIDGKQATADVFETVVVTWDYIDPSKVMGTAYVTEDAWSNRKHRITLILTDEGRWLIDQDIVK